MGKKFALLWCLSTVFGLYKAFVLLNLWNWFVVEAFHVSPITFLPMLGVLWFVQLVTDHPNRDAELLWKKTYALLDLCIPEQKREVVPDVLKQLDDETWEEIWFSVGQQTFAATVTLVLGFCVHLLV